ncbi:NAD(P)H-dependent FMN reductase [Saonia flava]|uniref:NAD(P)H-dependent FMN reductase n=1 Tax=Saonia flava TaxID=523696 RepID=A0A846QSB5_9FLAO|nr:NAD(P)H-dependent oxidoreductase [Saonia flava]NJB70097.1 NAD(P)H-dependent FMN reductase [Saonia flava]
MAKILAFAGSNSSTSINFKLVQHTISQIDGHDIQLLNLANFPFPMYSEDYERENGYSNSLIELKNDIKSAHALVVSVNEHNGNPSAYFKNLLDWLSRVERKFLEGKKILLMSTSPGKGGAKSSLGVISSSFPRFGGEIVSSFSLPSFNTNFNEEKGITDSELSDAYKDALNDFLSSI